MKKKDKQSQPLRVENWDYNSFITSRCITSRLWFVNNNYLEERILGYLGKYANHQSVKLYSFVIQGNHYHMAADFRHSRRASFFRDFNARITESVKATVANFEGGPLFERRYSEQALPLDADLEERFFYCALQPVNAGLCERAEDYQGYNSFWDAINGAEREVKVVDGTKYRRAKRRKKDVNIEDYTTVYKLKYERLPGYEALSQEEYKDLMLKKYEEKRKAKVADLRAEGYVFPPINNLREIVPGSKPTHSKKSNLDSKRPLVLTNNLAAKQAFLDWYFSVRAKYKDAAKKYRKGDLTVKFPKGTYRPPLYALA